jgi:hypothetical protein
VSVHHRRVRVAHRCVALGAFVVAPLLAVTALGAGATGSNELAVKASEYTYKVSGSPKAGWVKIAFDNAGVENHMLAIVELKKGVTLKQLEQAATSNDDSAFQKIAAPGATPNGPSGTPDLLGPKQETATITQLPAGHYGMLCFLPAPDGTPHVMKGMAKLVDIKKGKSSLTPPETARDATLTDTGITFDTSDIGRNITVKVTNEGQNVHSFTLVKVEDGHTLGEVRDYFNAMFNGSGSGSDASATPPGEIVGGIASIDPGKTAYLEQTLEPGHYGYVSTQGDDPATDDYTKGLHGEFDVK